MANTLGVTKSTLIRKIKTMGIEFPNKANLGPANCHFCTTPSINQKNTDMMREESNTTLTLNQNNERAKEKFITSPRMNQSNVKRVK